jgi:hypothetical protein
VYVGKLKKVLEVLLYLTILFNQLAAFIVHMLKEWPQAISDVVNMFSNERILSQQIQQWILFDVLSDIPEEATTVFTSVQRVALKHEINKNAPMVLQTMENFINMKCELPQFEDEDISSLQNVANCASNWFKNGIIPLDNCVSVSNSILKLIVKIYWKALEADGCLSPDESELTETFLKALSDMMIQPDAHKYSKTALILMEIFLESLSPIVRNEWKKDNLNEDIAFSIYSLFITSIECHSRAILIGMCSQSQEHHKVYEQIINEILLCTDKPGIYPVEESCSKLAMSFWFLLQDEVLSYENEIDRQRCLEAITPVYAHLVKILVRKSQLPDEQSAGKWNADDLESLRCYRQDIADTLLSCYDVLHHQILKILAETLEEGILSIQTNPNNWTLLEASIHAFYAISQNLDSTEYPEIVRLIQLLNEIPYEKTNEKLFGTALETMGSFSEWVNDFPKYLPNAIQLLVKGLDSSMSSQATLGLKDLTSECRVEQMIPLAEPLLNACQQALMKGHLANSESIRLMYSIGNVMSILSPEQIPMYLDRIVSPCFKELQMLAEQRSNTDAARLRVTYCLSMVSTLFSSLNVNKSKRIQPMTLNDQPQPILLILQKTMPIFKEICDLYIHDVQIVEILCMAIQQALGNLKDDIKPILNDLCMLIVSIFQNKCVPPAIDIAGSVSYTYY